MGGLLANLLSKLAANVSHGLSPLCYLKAQNHKLKQSKVSLSVVLSQALWNKPVVPGILQAETRESQFQNQASLVN